MKPKTKLITGLVILFLAGAVVGSVGTGLFLKERMGSFSRSQPEVRAQRITAKLTKKFDLTDDQKNQVQAILLKDMTLEHGERHERVKEGINRRLDQIREILTEEQQQKLEAHRTQLLERIEKRFREK